MADFPQKPKHYPYEEEAQLMLDVVNFFIHKLPHAIDMTAQRFDEAALAHTFTDRLEAMSDGQLRDLGVHRDDIPELAAAAAGLFRVAHKAENNRG